MTQVEQLLALLADQPMTTQEMAEAVDFSAGYVRTLASYLHAQWFTPRCRGVKGTRTRKLKQIYIQSWRRDDDTTGIHTRAVYAVGSHKDAIKPPKLTRTEHNTRHREKKRRAVSTVWALAIPLDDRRLTARVRSRPTASLPPALP